MVDHADDPNILVRFASFSRLSSADFGALRGLANGRRSLKRGDNLHSAGDEPPGLHLLLEGWTASRTLFEDGTSQMIKVHMAGDVIGMPSLAINRAADTVSALSPATVTAVSHRALGRLFEDHPRIAALLFLISQEERVMLMDRVASLGQSDAASRVATLILQLQRRLFRQNSLLADSFDVPLTQQDLGELAGLTTVHANRVLQKLRRDGIIVWARRRVQILDRGALIRLSGLPHRTLVSEPAWLPASR